MSKKVLLRTHNSQPKTCPLGFRDESQDLPVVTIRHDIERAVRPFINRADPRVEIRQQTFLCDNPLTVEHETCKSTSDHFGDEEVALPCRKESSRVERDSGGSNVGCPEIDWLFHSLLHRLVVV